MSREDEERREKPTNGKELAALLGEGAGWSACGGRTAGHAEARVRVGLGVAVGRYRAVHVGDPHSGGNGDTPRIALEMLAHALAARADALERKAADARLRAQDAARWLPQGVSGKATASSSVALAHVFYSGVDCGCNFATCWKCEGTLSMCKVCGQAEGELAASCPGRKPAADKATP